VQDLSEIDFKSGAILLVDKPKEWSSFDVVRKIRNTIGEKTGHGGTLDPLATGLMIIATGKYTKKLNELQNLPKEYDGIMYLGATTPSYDKETEVNEEWVISHITEADIQNAAESLTGVIEQVPPVYSAIKIEGKPSYLLARKGKGKELQARSQEIFEFEITKTELPFIHFRVHCSKGTYIRSLVHDFGKALGVGAYMDELRRTKIGEYRLEDAWKLDELIEKLKEKRKQQHIQ
jgi:tRNA pseudouridine55 synthase